MSDLAGLLDRFSALRTVVVGDAVLDRYLHGRAHRLCREAPVPVVDVTESWDVPGGAGNAAVNVATLGASSSLVSMIGADADGERLVCALERFGVATHGVMRSTSRRTPVKSRVVVDSQVLVRFDQGAAGDLSPEEEALVVASLEEALAGCDALIVSDYGYGTVGPAVIRALKAAQASSPRVLVVDARDLPRYRGVGMSLAKPNYEEVARLLRLPAAAERARPEMVERLGPELLALSGAGAVAVRLDSDGALLFQAGSDPYRTYARPSPPSKAAGAGDTFAAAAALALAAGSSLPVAVEVASVAAGVVVGRDGTTACSAGELRQRFFATDKFLDEGALHQRLAAHHEQGRRIVFTNGCFDIIHLGHVACLNRAKSLGDVLIVGVNSDRSVRRLKGAARPINRFEDRVRVLAELSCVDHIVALDDDTATGLIEVARPDLYVKGGDYSRETLPETAAVERHGGEVHILPYLEGLSTTSLIEKIRTSEVQGAAGPGPLTFS